ncbi:hypothetical protein ACTHGU_21765 [Chitinophagaceae bacterium MMS25-I14]
MHRIYTFILLAAIFLATSQHVTAQQQPAKRSANTVKKKKQVEISVGFGLGLDYGGIGARVEVRPVDYLGIFAGGGYNLNALGYNVGVKANLLHQHRVQPFATAMYGYNGVIVVRNEERYNRTYYGPTAGGGIDILLGRKRNARFSAGILVPFRNSSFQDDYDRLKNDPNIKFNNDPSPIAITIGFNFKLQ